MVPVVLLVALQEKKTMTKIFVSNIFLHVAVDQLDFHIVFAIYAFVAFDPCLLEFQIKHQNKILNIYISKFFIVFDFFCVPTNAFCIVGKRPFCICC